MSKEILMVVDAVSNEKGVEKDIIFGAISKFVSVSTARRANMTRFGVGSSLQMTRQSSKRLIASCA